MLHRFLAFLAVFLGKLPVVNFSAGGVASPADAALMMQLGAEGVFVGSGIFESGKNIHPVCDLADPNHDKDAHGRMLDAQRRMATAIVKAVTHFNDAHILAEVSADVPESMRGQSVAQMAPAELLAGRGN